ncbi:MAG: hypothetical protein R3F21_22270 [Myxococcota bacterium]
MFEATKRGVLVVAVGWTLSACASLPEISRTQEVHDVKVEEGVSPAELYVDPGDEVRWVNLRKEVIFVQIADLQKDDLACQRGFGNWRGALIESIEVEPNQTVSLCFKKPGQVRYNVRAETAVGGGDAVFPGLLRIGESSMPSSSIY